MTYSDVSDAWPGSSSPSQLNINATPSNSITAVAAAHLVHHALHATVHTRSNRSSLPTCSPHAPPHLAHTVANDQILSQLKERVVDWKGRNNTKFGSCILQRFPMTVTRSGVDRPYHVVIFERIILCLKEQSSSNRTLKSPASAMVPHKA
ncbi:hypothetical protein HGRIS_005369 [Hohenbuehelia grisea]|uniref:Uncharacterized protein n=1 Tax=Hohenbuehelia grisea TaxID=104357 RepID=A0ABR3JEV1_9AGAR